MNKAEMSAYLLAKTIEYAESKEILLYAADPLPKTTSRYQGVKKANLRNEAYQQYLEELGANTP